MNPTPVTLDDLAGLACLADIVRRLKYFNIAYSDSNITINPDLLFPSLGDASTRAAPMDEYMWELSCEFYKNEIISGLSARRASINVVKSIYFILESSKLFSSELFLPLVQACLSHEASADFKNIVLNNLPQDMIGGFEALCELGWMRCLPDFSQLSEQDKIFYVNQARSQITGIPMNPEGVEMDLGGIGLNQEEPTEYVGVGR